MALVMIEVNIPAGRSIAEAKQAVERQFSDDWMAEWWHIEDVKEQYLGDGEYQELTDDEARQVLKLLSKNHDCEVGINWETIDSWSEHVVQQRGVV